MNESARVACCLICLVGDRFKACQSCAFNAGLAVKAAIEAGKNSEFSTIEAEELKP